MVMREEWHVVQWWPGLKSENKFNKHSIWKTENRIRLGFCLWMGQCSLGQACSELGMSFLNNVEWITKVKSSKVMGGLQTDIHHFWTSCITLSFQYLNKTTVFNSSTVVSSHHTSFTAAAVYFSSCVCFVAFIMCRLASLSIPKRLVDFCFSRELVLTNSSYLLALHEVKLQHRCFCYKWNFRI